MIEVTVHLAGTLIKINKVVDVRMNEYTRDVDVFSKDGQFYRYNLKNKNLDRIEVKYFD